MGGGGSGFRKLCGSNRCEVEKMEAIVRGMLKEGQGTVCSRVCMMDVFCFLMSQS